MSSKLEIHGWVRRTFCLGGVVLFFAYTAIAIALGFLREKLGQDLFELLLMITLSAPFIYIFFVSFVLTKHKAKTPLEQVSSVEISVGGLVKNSPKGTPKNAHPQRVEDWLSKNTKPADFKSLLEKGELQFTLMDGSKYDLLLNFITLYKGGSKKETVHAGPAMLPYLESLGPHQIRWVCTHINVN